MIVQRVPSAFLANERQSSTKAVHVRPDLEPGKRTCSARARLDLHFSVLRSLSRSELVGWPRQRQWGPVVIRSDPGLTLW